MKHISSLKILSLIMCLTIISLDSALAQQCTELVNNELSRANVKPPEVTEEINFEDDYAKIYDLLLSNHRKIRKSAEKKISKESTQRGPLIIKNARRKRLWLIKASFKSIENSVETKKLKDFRKLIEPFRASFDNALNDNIKFDKIVKYGKAPNLSYVFTLKGKPVLIQSSQSNKKLVQTKIAKVTEECKVDDFITANENIKEGVISYEYFNSRICSKPALRKLRSLTNSVKKTENNRLFKGNQINFRCEEQGGDSSSGCKCPDGRYINPFALSCFAKRVLQKKTPKDNLIAFNEAHDSLINANSGSVNDYKDAKDACAYYKGDLSVNYKNNSASGNKSVSGDSIDN